MKRIDKLTTEQEAYLPKFRQMYLDKALNPKRIEFDKLQLAINDVYDLVGKKPPVILTLDSPLQAMIAINVCERFFSMDQFSNQLWGQLWGQLGGRLGGRLGKRLDDQFDVQLWGQLNDRLRYQLCDQLDVQLSNQLWVQLWDQLCDQLDGQLSDQLDGQLSDQLDGQLRYQLDGQLRYQLDGQLRYQLDGQFGVQLDDQLWDMKLEYKSNYLWGSQDFYWIALYKFAEYIGVEFEKEGLRKLNIMERIGEQCEWWWPYKGICFVSQKPIEVNWDQQGRLHSETKAAIKYADGFSVFSWHGTKIPAQWILDKANLDPQIALTWENMEQRRAACEIIGWDKVIERLNPVVIHKDEDPEIGELLKVNLPDVGEKLFLKVKCGTGRTFCLRVPDNMKTARQANAATFGLKENEYNPIIRT